MSSSACTVLLASQKQGSRNKAGGFTESLGLLPRLKPRCGHPCLALVLFVRSMAQGSTLRVVESEEGTFQDFPELDGLASALEFTGDGSLLLIATGCEVQVWRVLV
jgi:hypothetical protein